MAGEASIPGEGAEAEPEGGLEEPERRGGCCGAGSGTGRSEHPEVEESLRYFHQVCLS